MRERILVINPNSTVAVTRAIDEAMAPLRLPGGPEIQCVTLEEGPPGVETQLDADGVIFPMCRVIREHDADADAFVIACFSDPGLFSAREATAKPVLGIAECGILTALTLGHRFGVISILARSVPRHLRYIAAMGVGQRLAGDLPIGLGVTELADGRRTLSRMIEIGRRLRDQCGADVLVMGCAGMARYRADLEEAVQIPVFEPSKKRGGWSWWYLLFLIQFVAVLWPPFYNKAEPYWVGLPFFYWYQLLWIIIGAALTAIVYFATEN